MKKIAIYPGSFDPITNGHIDIIKRALKLFDEIIVLIAVNPNKTSYFSLEERMLMIQESLVEFKNVKVDSTTGLTVQYAKKAGSKAMIRGIRALTDFEYEFSINIANKFIDNDVESVFFMAKQEYMFISSSNIKLLVANGVDISQLVPKPVLKRLLEFNPDE